MLTQEQIDRFHRDGYLKMPGLLSGAELAALQAATLPIIENGIAGVGEHHEYQMHPSGKKVYWRTNNMWQKGDVFKAVTLNPDLLENIGQCIGQAFHPQDDALVVKLPDAGAPVPWHQDPPYGNPAITQTHPIPNFVADLYLDHSTVKNGCVWAIPGSHLVGHIDLKQKTAEQLFAECGAVPVEMEPGDVLFHSLSVPHGSQASSEAGMRRVFYIHYVADPVYHALYHPYYQNDRAPAYKREGAQTMQPMIVEMQEARRAWGWEMPDARSTLSLGPDGFEFIGNCKTPREYWEQAASGMADAERAARQRLERMK